MFKQLEMLTGLMLNKYIYVYNHETCTTTYKNYFNLFKQKADNNHFRYFLF